MTATIEWGTGNAGCPEEGKEEMSVHPSPNALSPHYRCLSSLFHSSPLRLSRPVFRRARSGPSAAGREGCGGVRPLHQGSSFHGLLQAPLPSVAIAGHVQGLSLTFLLSFSIFSFLLVFFLFSPSLTCIKTKHTHTHTTE
jgi:hypothetical protein